VTGSTAAEAAVRAYLEDAGIEWELGGRPGEFVGAALANWLPGQGVELTPVAAASPWQNGFVESFHSRLRDEFLHGAGFENVADAKARAAWFKRDYNEVRPHSGLNYETPKAFAARCGEKAGRRKRVGAGGNPPVRVRA